MNTDRIASFIAAAEAGSLSKAATRLGEQLSSVSRHVTELEGELNARLFERTGRGVRLTLAGERFLERGRTILRELEQARAEARGEQPKEPSVLRLSSPPDLAQSLFPGVLARLAERFPDLSVHSRGDVRRVSLVEESYDAVVRLGPLTPSDLIATRLGTLTRTLYAPPGRGLSRLGELAARDAVLVEGTPPEVLALYRGRTVRLALQGRLRVGSFSEAAALAADTGRLALLPTFSARALVTAGRLQRALPGLAFPTIDAHLLKPPRHRGSQVLETLAQLLQEALREAEAPPPTPRLDRTQGPPVLQEGPLRGQRRR